MPKVRTDISTLPPTQRAQAAEQHVQTLLTDVEPPIVTPQQETAILTLLTGGRQQDAAQAAHVTPETVSRWLANDARFVALLNARRQELWEAHRAKLRALVDMAVETVEDCMSSGKPENRLKAAMVVLEAAGALGQVTPAALPTNVAAVERQWFDERRRNEISAIDLMMF